MLAQLVKVANRLDSLGLTKEADILDLEIIRLASDSGPGMTRVQLAEKNVETAQKAFDEAVKALKEVKSISARPKLNEAKKAAERNLEKANSELERAQEIQNEYPKKSTEETSTEREPFVYPIVYPEVMNRRIRSPGLEEYPNMNIPSETIIEKEYPTEPKELADLDPDLFYVFQLIKPELKKPIWLFDRMFSTLEDANSHIGEEDDKIVLIGKKVKEYILKGKDVYNSGAMLRLRPLWEDPLGGVSLFKDITPDISTPRAKGAE